MQSWFLGLLVLSGWCNYRKSYQNFQKRAVQPFGHPAVDVLKHAMRLLPFFLKKSLFLAELILTIHIVGKLSFSQYSGLHRK